MCNIQPARLGLILLVLSASSAVPASYCRADEDPACQCPTSECSMDSGWTHRRLFDGTTLSAWRQTWHGPNALETPLTPYYVPRTSVGGCHPECAAGYGDVLCEDCRISAGTGGRCAGTGSCYPLEMAFEPRGMERLGRVPNDLDLSGGLLGNPASRPNR